MEIWNFLICDLDSDWIDNCKKSSKMNLKTSLKLKEMIKFSWMSQRQGKDFQSAKSVQSQQVVAILVWLTGNGAAIK